MRLLSITLVAITVLVVLFFIIKMNISYHKFIKNLTPEELEAHNEEVATELRIW